MPRNPRSLAAASLILLGLAAPAASAQLDFGKALGGFDQVPVESVFGDSRDVLSASVVLAQDAISPGGDLPVAIVLEIQEGWHLWTQPGVELEGASEFDGAIETEIEIVSMPTGLVAHPGFTQWPEPHLISADLGEGPASYAVFEGTSVVYLPVTASADAPAGDGELVFRLGFQACDDSTCMAPASLELRARIVVGEAAGGGDVGETFAGFDPAVFGRIRSGEAAPEVVDFDAFGLQISVDIRGAGFLLLLLLAAVGGLLLNFTPCVLPVIPLKIMALSQAAGNRGRCFLLGLSMSLGVVGFWLGLGLAVASISGFTATNQLFQSPIFTITVGVVIAVLAIGMMGVFTIRLPQALYMIEPRHDTLVGSFGFGVMTAVLSTPCTAPFMGSAVVWAVTGSIVTVLLVFGAVGLGMALPYLVLAAFPGLVKNMPRSGPASDLIKQVMGLLLLAAAAYFAGAGLSGLMVEPPEPPSKAYWWVVGIAGVAAGGLMLVRTLRIATTTPPKVVFGGLGALIVVVSGFIAFRMTDEGPIDWTYYTPELLAEAQADGEVVVLDFTAEWCLNCKALESSVLALPSVADRLNGDGVVAMKVDLTGNNEAGNELLRASGRLTIPLLVVLDADGKEIFKSDAYTPRQVIDAIDAALAAGNADS